MNKRRRLRDRPQAIWGALLSAGVGLASNLISSKKQAKAQEKAAAEQAAAQQYADAIRSANNMSQVLNAARDRQNDYIDDFHVNYANGGKVCRRRLRTGGVITDGGIAIPIDNDTFLLQGSSHNQVNESGNTGIGININGKEIEAEGGEVADIKGDSMRIFSDRIKLPRKRYLRKGGNVKITPAQAVQAGYNPDKVFAVQEAYKKNNNLKNPSGKALYGYNLPYVYKKRRKGNSAEPRYEFEQAIDPEDYTNLMNGRPTLTQRYFGPWWLNRDILTKPLKLDGTSKLDEAVANKEYKPSVDLGTYTINKPASYSELVNTGKQKVKTYGENPLVYGRGFDLTWGDVANAGIGITGSILSNIISNRAYNNLRKYAPTAPSSLIALPLRTYYNIHPQLAELERNRLRTQQAINNNTWSSVAALNRMNTNNVNTVEEANKLWGIKFNKENELINESIKNQQDMANKNIEAMNNYRLRLADYNRGIGLAKAQSNVAMIQGIGSSLSNMIQAGMDRYDDNLAKIATLAQAEPSTLDYLRIKYPRLFRGLC